MLQMLIHRNLLKSDLARLKSGNDKLETTPADLIRLTKVEKINTKEHVKKQIFIII